MAFCCAEFGVHGSLPIYSGGLGILAGDILKEASDLALPMVGVGLMYRTGYFHQRIDVTGLQHEYWLDADPDRLPCVLVSGADGQPLTVRVPVDDEDLVAQVWRVDVGRVPLVPARHRPAREQRGRALGHLAPVRKQPRASAWRSTRCSGSAGMRALQAMGIEPSVVPPERRPPGAGRCSSCWRRQRAQQPGLATTRPGSACASSVVFTTHTPVAAGNETYARDEVLAMLGRLADASGDRERFLALGRIDPAQPEQPSGMTALALRSSRQANAVSQRHGEVARGMWQPLFPGRAREGVPITHVTNGVHVPTWLHGPMRELLDRHLGAGWLARADQPETWAPLADVPAAELWAARCAARGPAGRA